MIDHVSWIAQDSICLYLCPKILILPFFALRSVLVRMINYIMLLLILRVDSLAGAYPKKWIYFVLFCNGLILVSLKRRIVGQWYLGNTNKNFSPIKNCFWIELFSHVELSLETTLSVDCLKSRMLLLGGMFYYLYFGIPAFMNTTEWFPRPSPSSVPHIWAPW